MAKAVRQLPCDHCGKKTRYQRSVERPIACCDECSEAAVRAVDAIRCECGRSIYRDHFRDIDSGDAHHDQGKIMWRAYRTDRAAGQLTGHVCMPCYNAAVEARQVREGTLRPRCLGGCGEGASSPDPDETAESFRYCPTCWYAEQTCRAAGVELLSLLDTTEEREGAPSANRGHGAREAILLPFRSRCFDLASITLTKDTPCSEILSRLLRETVALLDLTLAEMPAPDETDRSVLIAEVARAVTAAYPSRAPRLLRELERRMPQEGAAS